MLTSTEIISEVPAVGAEVAFLLGVYAVAPATVKGRSLNEATRREAAG
jgi:hypothetical protein